MVFAVAMSPAHGEGRVTLHAAGSLSDALGELATGWAEREGVALDATFAPSGLLRERIEGGEPAEVFASANMTHPAALYEAGLAAPVVLFARNRLCALTAPGVDIGSDALLDTMLSDDVRLGTSTPGADPSGDYAFTLFDRAESLRPGARQALGAKALQLTGGPDSEPPPDGRNAYAWVMDSGRADIFLTYCTNAVLAQREVAGLGIVQVPDALAVGADYGLTVLDGASEPAWRLAFHILSPAGQAVLAEYGFTVSALPDGR